jgi:FKBP-type peptidyl-prolyl cis-trans isomerase 2
MTSKNIKTVQKGDKVVLHYVGTLDDGEQFDNSYNRGAPVEVEVGSGNLIVGFENAVIGMYVGQKKTVNLVKEDAYGDINPAAVVTVPKEGFPSDFPFDKKGVVVPLRNEDGQEFFGRLKDVGEETVVVDLNHPMAGKNLNFDIELVGITTESHAASADTAQKTTATKAKATKTTKKKATKAKTTKTTKAKTKKTKTKA